MTDKDETELNQCELYRDLMRLGALVQSLRNEISELRMDIFTYSELHGLTQKFATISHFSMVGKSLVQKIFDAVIKEEEEESEGPYCSRDEEEEGDEE